MASYVTSMVGIKSILTLLRSLLLLESYLSPAVRRTAIAFGIFNTIFYEVI